MQSSIIPHFDDTTQCYSQSVCVYLTSWESFSDILLQTAENLKQNKKTVQLNWFGAPQGTQTLQRIKCFSVLHPLLNTVHSSFLMRNALLSHVRYASHTIHILLATGWHIWYIKYDRLLNNTAVYWTPSRRCLCNHRATLPHLMINLHRYAAFCIMTHCKELAALQRKQKLEFKLGQHISVSSHCFLSQDAFVSASLVYFIFHLCLPS